MSEENEVLLQFVELGVSNLKDKIKALQEENKELKEANKKLLDRLLK